jgi:SAM-dependent methyltransferase
VSGARDPFPRFFEALEARHRRGLEFGEIRKGLQALSSLYVERRARLGRLFDGAGKRAAFALYYGPLHLLTLREIVRRLPARGPRSILDLGCGTAAAGAAWAVEIGAAYEGVERSAWAVEEARFTLKALGATGRVRRDDLSGQRLPGRGAGILLAWTANELDDATRSRLLRDLLDAHARGASALVVEPISRRLSPWWDAWRTAFEERGGRADEWRFPARLPPTLALLDKAASLDHRELLARSLWLGPPSGPT